MSTTAQPKTLVFATNNAHKLAEIRRILGAGMGAYRVLSLAEIGCNDDIPEKADTLEGNALQKARYVHERYGYDCFADDTGLEVDALDGAPGVYSARYASQDGSHPTYEQNVAKLLREMDGKTQRTARFRTVIALILDGREYTFDGLVEGYITTEPRGNDGFGYDPVFEVADERHLTFAQMSPDQKNAVSHRGRATQRLVHFLTNKQ